MRHTNQFTGLRFLFVFGFLLCAAFASFLAPLEAVAEGANPDIPAEGDTLGGSSDTLNAIIPTAETVSDWQIILTLIDVII